MEPEKLLERAEITGGVWGWVVGDSRVVRQQGWRIVVELLEPLIGCAANPKSRNVGGASGGGLCIF